MHRTSIFEALYDTLFCRPDDLRLHWVSIAALRYA